MFFIRYKNKIEKRTYPPQLLHAALCSLGFMNINQIVRLSQRNTAFLQLLLNIVKIRAAAFHPLTHFLVDP